METRKSYDMYVPTRTLFGVGMLNELHAQTMPGKKALLVISAGKSTRANGYLDRTINQLAKAGVGYVLFDKITANPELPVIDEGGHLAADSGCDMVVALGGGSVMDAAKAIAAVASNGGSWWDYVPAGTGKGQPMKNKPLPIIAISTTAGTGSETDNGMVISNPTTNEKIGFGNNDFFPVLAIVDPELTLTVPPKFSAFQGFDALFHSVEAFISTEANLMSDMYAEKAIHSVATYLPRCIKDGSDTEARTMVSWGNTLSGTVMCVGACTSEHALEHAMSAFHENLPHGAGLIMISLAFYRHFINLHVCDDRFVRLARLMGLKDAEKAEDFLTALHDLQKNCGVADLKMSDYGISPDEFPAMVRNARETTAFLFETDRVKLSDEDYIKIYTESFK